MKDVIIYEDAKRVCVATGLERPSENAKTGPMVQTWVLVRAESPLSAVSEGNDSVVCGLCPLRGDGNGKGRLCYVNVARAPTTVHARYRRGGYEREWVPEMFAGRAVRLGAYGDPAFVPLRVWQRVLRHVSGWTGYTHQWRASRVQPYRELLMASVETPREAAEAQALGWRTFRIGQKPGKMEERCPYETDGVQCRDCCKCDGTIGGGKSIVAPPKGAPWVRVALGG